jgi:hypothetical protein
VGEQAFAATALRLSGLAMAITGWRPDDFWRATPQELESLLGGLHAALPPAAASGPATMTDLQKMQEHFPDG